MINIKRDQLYLSSFRKINNIYDINFNLDLEIINLRNDILKSLTNDLSFDSFGELLCKRIQAIIPSAYVSLCCIENNQMIPWAAPDIAPEYGFSYAGLEIGENVGSCGSAAFLKQPVIVHDIETDPRWTKYKNIALPFGLRSCCSYPVKDNLDNVVATFAFYFKGHIDIDADILLKLAEAGVEFCLLAIDKENQKKTIRNLTFFDQLTGLPNRTNLLHHIDQYCSEGQYIYMLDIDNFKEINILIGYALGDQVLKTLSERLKNKINDQLFISRLERDIFIIVTPNRNPTEAIAQIIHNMVSEEIVILNQSFLLTVSIGFTQYKNTNKTTWLSECKSALYQAKMSNGNSCVCFSNSIAESEKEKINIIQLLKKALLSNQLELFYQPQINMRTNSVYGLEALLRFRHPVSKKYIPPNIFIPLIEETGLIDNLGYWVLDQVCHQINIWDKKNIFPPKISVNLSASNFQNPDLSYYIKSLLDKYALSGSKLTLEITENAMISLSEHMLKNISSIKDLGVHLSIDDFGTGYSNLSNLINLPVNEIKIDKSFIDKMNQDQKIITLISTMINLAKNLQLNIVAEGVESFEQHQLLKELNCSIIQGYFYAKPMPLNLIEHWLREELDDSNQIHH